ncbi:hypothetical protein BCV70DRAFT_201516 [Testicularia cyperi]|uniref:Uncharacterized protein n=1 Tax=Testicularia cyperi TaxID=1882483 RepID=A0A317XK78_9BASI|nr:hypothetical protein BCV70DRAFT_201516 [Testicularia cyperi]
MGKKAAKRQHKGSRSHADVTSIKGHGQEGAHNDSEDGSSEEVTPEPNYDGAENLPAHRTKHLSRLSYRFRSLGITLNLTQRNDTNSTGSSLWLSSQVLSSYLIHTYSSKESRASISAASTPAIKANKANRRAIELGSGTGLLSLLLATLGWSVLATDIPPVLDTVLRPNVEEGAYQLVNTAQISADQLAVHELDWTTKPNLWHWDQAGPCTVAPATQSSNDNPDAGTVEHDFELILTADTVYEPSLVRPLVSIISHLYRTRSGSSKPTVLLALERRDSNHIDGALQVASDDFGLDFKQIPAKRVRKIFDTLGEGATWSRQDWDGVEIWKL